MSEVKVAFIGDQGLGPNALAVLQLIFDEGADMVVHSGDFDYADNPTAWDNQITGVLGANYPYFASFGNHDIPQWPAYQQKMLDRLNGLSAVDPDFDFNLDCSVAPVGAAGFPGQFGVNSSCNYKGIFIILSGVGTLFTQGINHTDYIRDELAQDDSIWSICSWHKNQTAMQVGLKGNEVGWGPYEACREGGAIVATSHEHSYERTRTLSNFETQTVDLSQPPNALQVGNNSSFAFVSGLGGRSVRNQDRCLPTTPPYGCGGEWASIYTSDQAGTFGALFIDFNFGGDPTQAHGYFKNINGIIIDDFTISAVGFNTPPVAGPDSDTVAEGGSVNIDVLANDTDVEFDPLTITGVTQGSNGAVTFNSAGLTYTHDGSETLADNFEYTLSDRTGTAIGTVLITVTPVNDAPAAQDQSITTLPGSPIGLTLTGSDPEGDSLTFAVATPPGNGSLNAAAPYIYTPDAGFAGLDSFTFTASDGLLDSDPATVSITVNTPPVANPDNGVVDEDSSIIIDVLVNDDDDDGNPLTITGVTQGINGAVTVTGASLTYAHDGSETLGDRFTYDISDGFGGTSTGAVTVTVTPVNDAPILDDQAIITSQDVAVAITLTGSDAEGDALTFAIVTAPGDGILEGAAPSLTYTPNSGFAGPDSFTFIANDGALNSSPATVSITVAPPITVSLAVTDGWDQKLGKTLSEDGKLYTVRASDSERWETEGNGNFTSFNFEVGIIPAGATIQSVVVYGEHWEEEGFTPGELKLHVGATGLEDPGWFGEVAATLGTEDAEVTDSWDVTDLPDWTTEIDNLKLVFENTDPEGKKSKINTVWVEVTYIP